MEPAFAARGRMAVRQRGCHRRLGRNANPTKPTPNSRTVLGSGVEVGGVDDDGTKNRSSTEVIVAVPLFPIALKSLVILSWETAEKVSVRESVPGLPGLIASESCVKQGAVAGGAVPPAQ
jgi:hypothetical protein